MGTTTLGIRDLEVVGESHYQRAIRKARKRQVQTVQLIADRRNKYDKNAVRVVMRVGWRSRTVGHLSRGTAKRYQPLVRAAKKRGELVELPARIYGGTRQRRLLGVWIGTDHA